MAWKVIQHRYIKDSDQNNRPNVVWSGGRYKEAKGQAKSNLMSHMEMLDKHEHFPFAAWTIDMEAYRVEIYDDDATLLYSIQYEVIEDVL